MFKKKNSDTDAELSSGADMGFPPSGPTGTKAKVALPERSKAAPLFKKKRHDKAPGNHLRTAGGNRGMSK